MLGADARLFRQARSPSTSTGHGPGRSAGGTRRRVRSATSPRRVPRPDAGVATCSLDWVISCRPYDAQREDPAMSRMKLYAHPFSNNSMRPQLSLEEKHLDYDYMKVDLFKGEHKHPEHMALNPR